MVLRRKLASTLSLFCILGFLFTACQKKPAGKRYELHGHVVAADSGARTLTIAHEDVPGLMKAMTMPFEVGSSDQWVFGKIEPGDQVHATLVIGERAQLEDISFNRGSESSGDGSSDLHLPQPGDQVPDFGLVNQNGKAIRLSQFHGRPLLLTFLSTRCPVPDFCLLMSNNFSEILKELQQDATTKGKAQLLSISIDPEYDKPPVLRSYGERYNTNVDPDFRQWQFASGTYDQVRDAAKYFGLSYSEKYGQIIHSLSTVLIGADGKIVKVYTGNQWKPDEVAADYETATKASGADKLR